MWLSLSLHLLIAFQSSPISKQELLSIPVCFRCISWELRPFFFWCHLLLLKLDPFSSETRSHPCFSKTSKSHLLLFLLEQHQLFSPFQYLSVKYSWFFLTWPCIYFLIGLLLCVSFRCVFRAVILTSNIPNELNENPHSTVSTISLQSWS